MDDTKIIPTTSNVFKVVHGDVEIEIYCTGDSIEVSNISNNKIEFPRYMSNMKRCKDRVSIKLNNASHAEGEER